jgi:Aerotolerance regulator N-terminal/von Willebrand factor type A domain
MSFLTPLYVLGLAAVVAPIVFHLIRRSPKGDVPFSSLMFLSPTPPRLTRRSRLDHLLLLLLRAAALCLLAFAFAKPFLRQAARLDFGDVDQRRIALLVDTSASMRRGDLWPRAQAMARQVVLECRPTDQLAVFGFDATSRPLLGFHESMTMDSAQRQSTALAVLDGMAPTWGATDLGQALVDTVAAIEDVADSSNKSARMPRRVVLISDLTAGSRLDALGDFEWPSDVDLDLKTVADTRSNAGLERLADQNDAESNDADTSRRVRVVNNPRSQAEKFALAWIDENGVTTGKPTEVYVPAGESRVVRVPRPTSKSQRQSLRLSGDAHAFDNSLYFADERREDVSVLYVGPDKGDDPQGLFYYLQRAFPDSHQRHVGILSRLPGDVLEWNSKETPRLAIVTAETPRNVSGLRQYLQDGGTVLYVVTAPGPATTLAGLAGVSPWTIDEAKVARDMVLGEIAFDHPIFAPLAGAQFNDFTKIRFWKYRRIDAKSLGEARVLARFETGDPAVIEKPIGKGRLVVLASGWQPADSQLARSSKFVPILTAIRDERITQPLGAVNLRVGQRVPLPVADDAGKSMIVHKPDGASVTLSPQTAYFDETDQPGLYRVDTPTGALSFAVNLDPMESKTEPLHVETLEQLGARLANHSQKNVDRELLRQMYNEELENRQKLWRWLILAAIGILIVETWLAGRTLDRPRSGVAEALAT